MATENPVDTLFSLFSPTIRFPGSGDMGGFRYAPHTSWEAPALLRGNDLIEQAVYREVASPGTQLGVVIDALLVLAEQHPGLDQHEAIRKLKDLGDQVDSTKRTVRRNAEKTLRSELDHLQRNDPEALQSLLQNYR